MQVRCPKFTGVDESSSRKPGIEKKTIQLSYGVYKTVDAKLELRHTGFDDALPCAAPLRVTITLPQKWHDEPTSVRVLKQHFLAAYRRKHPNAPLALAADDVVSLAVKDESMFVLEAAGGGRRHRDAGLLRQAGGVGDGRRRLARLGGRAE